MLRNIGFILAGLVILLSACGNISDTGVLPSPTSFDTDTDRGTPPSNEVMATGVIVPVAVSEMSFIIAGPVREILVKEGALVNEGGPLITLDTPDLEYAVVSAEASVSSAQAFASLQRFRRSIVNQAGKTLYLTGPHEVLEVADAKVAQAQAALDIAKAGLSQSILRAPYRSTVVEVAATVGQYIQPGQIVVTLADMSQFQVETTDLNERDIQNIRIGQDARILVKVLEREIPGTVKLISPRADFVEGDVVYKVIVELQTQPDALLWGMSVDVNFSLE